jgi:hypothetical protein
MPEVAGIPVVSGSFGVADLSPPLIVGVSYRRIPALSLYRHMRQAVQGLRFCGIAGNG